MPNNNMPAAEQYNPRWFIWTIVFLVVTGVSLVAFITLSGSDGDYQDMGVPHRVKSVSQNK